VFRRIKEWLELFTADEPTPEQIMEIRAREGTLLDDLREAKEGVKGFLHELTEPDEDDCIYACYDNQGLDEIIEEIERPDCSIPSDPFCRRWPEFYDPIYCALPSNVFHSSDEED